MISEIITLLVGIATFIVGMNMMSGGLKKIAGKSVKAFFKRTQNNRWAGFGIGAGVTALIQSSAATSVIAVGFVNAGVMSVFQGTAVMMGSFVGTTITGILVSLSSFPISIWFTLLAVIGVILMFFKKEKIKNVGEILAGLGLLFFGLNVAKDEFAGSEAITGFTQNLFSVINFPLLLLLLGTLVTALIQSSSATIGLVIIMVGGGALTFASGLYLAIGATIGTCITTLLATIGGTNNAKRAGLNALIVKVVAGLIGTVIVWVFEGYISDFFAQTFGSTELGLAMFVMIYSVIFYFIFAMPLLTPLEKLSYKLIKDKEDVKKQKLLLYIDKRFLDTPEIALTSVKKEIMNMCMMTKTNFVAAYDLLVNENKSDVDIPSNEEAIDYINAKITEYLIELSNKVDSDESKIIGSYFHVINDIERIGDHAYNFYQSSLEMEENELHFSNNAKEDIIKFHDLVMKMFILALQIFDNNEKSHLSRLHELEVESDDLSHVLRSNHFKRLANNECDTTTSDQYTTLVSELERVADHLTNIGYSIINPTGDEEITNYN